MEQFFIKKDTLEATAEAIRNKTGIKEKIKPADFPEKINEIGTGADVSVVTATAKDVLTGKKFVDAEGNPKDGTMPNNVGYGRSISATIPYTYIPSGYHDGTGVIQAAYQSYKIVSPTKEEQHIYGDTFNDSYGQGQKKFLRSVTIRPIPDQYQDVTPVTTTAEDVRAGKVFVDAQGNKIAGAMPNNDAVDKVFCCGIDERDYYRIPEGYHGYNGKVQVRHGTASATPTKEIQRIRGKKISDETYGIYEYLDYVTINPIPDVYQDVTSVTATAEDVRAGKVFVDAQGNPIEGTALIQTDMHLSIEDMVAPSEFYQLWFRLNGTLYAAVGLSSSWEIYRYDDSWVKIIDETAVSLGRPSSSTYAIEYNGVVHFFAENKQNHYVFDGITLSQKLDLPNDTRSVCLHQEKIVNYMTDNCIYQWDEATETWTLLIENVSSSYYLTHIFTANGFLYIKDNTTLYKITDNGKEEVGNIPITVTQLVVKDNKVVILGEGQYYNSPKRVYTYDLITGTSAFLGNLPTSAEFMYICEDGSIRGLIDNDCPSDKTNSFILEIRGTVATTNEDWIITLEDGSVITKKMMVVATE